MITGKQLEANRANAALSTGPRSVAGKAVSSRNALSSGLYASKSRVLPNESVEEHEALVKSWYAQYRPVTPEAIALVNDAIRNTWALDRFDRIEVALLEQDVALSDPKALNSYLRLRRAIGQTQRALYRALDRLKDPAVNQLPEAQPQPQPVESKPAPPDDGFVPSFSDSAERDRAIAHLRLRYDRGEPLKPAAYRLLGLPVPGAAPKETL